MKKSILKKVLFIIILMLSIILIKNNSYAATKFENGGRITTPTEERGYIHYYNAAKNKNGRTYIVKKLEGDDKVYVSGSTLVIDPYVFCEQQNANMDGVFNYKVANIYENIVTDTSYPLGAKKYAIAYILAHDKFNGRGVVKTERYKKDTYDVNEAQAAFWHLLDAKTGLDPKTLKPNDLYYEATAFQNYREQVDSNGGIIVKKDETISYNSEAKTVGPFYVKYVTEGVGENKKTYSFGDVTEVKLTATVDGKDVELKLKNNDITICKNADGTGVSTKVPSNFERFLCKNK